jgi:hypothetical protein
MSTFASQLADPNHPVWKLGYLAVAVLALWLNASNFDETEIRSILYTLAGGYGVRLAQNSAASHRSRGQQIIDRAGGSSAYEPPEEDHPL